MMDQVNSLFIFVASAMTLNSCRVLYKDKLVRGFSAASQVFFLSWTFWSLGFYWSVDSYVSLIAELILSIACVVYVSMILYYLKLEKRHAKNR